MKNDGQYETSYIGSPQSLHEKGGFRPGEWETFPSTSQAFPDILVIRSRVLDREILVTRSRKLPVPPDLAHLPVFSLQELTALLESGVTREDVPRLFKIREEFSGVFVPQGVVSRPVANPRAVVAPDPQQPAETQGDLFA